MRSVTRGLDTRAISRIMLSPISEAGAGRRKYLDYYATDLYSETHKTVEQENDISAKQIIFQVA